MNKSLRSFLSLAAYPALVAWPLSVCYFALSWFKLPTEPLMGKAAEVALFLTWC